MDEYFPKEDNEMNDIPEIFTWELAVVLVVLAGLSFWWVRRVRKQK